MANNTPTKSKKIQKNIRPEEPSRVTNQSNILSTKIGTPLYASPEQEESIYYNAKTDVYSIGVILYEMLGQFTTYHQKYNHLNGLKVTGKVQPEFRRKFPVESDLIEDLTQKNTTNRPSSKKILTLASYMKWSITILDKNPGLVSHLQPTSTNFTPKCNKNTGLLPIQDKPYTNNDICDTFVKES